MRVDKDKNIVTQTLAVNDKYANYSSEFQEKLVLQHYGLKMGSILNCTLQKQVK